MQARRSIVIQSNEKMRAARPWQALEELAIDSQKSKSLSCTGGRQWRNSGSFRRLGNPPAVKRHWRVAKAWLYDKLSG